MNNIHTDYKEQTTTGNYGGTYNYNYVYMDNGHCPNRLPCGHCTILGKMCPYFIHPNFYKVTCEVGTHVQ